MCELGNFGAALESSKSAAVLKRMKEIEKKIETASETTACIILLPGKESYGQEDPKDAIRCGFALRNRLTQFIIPWKSGEEEDKKKQKAIETTIKSKIASAIEDLCRQLGYVRTLDEKLINKENMLVHTPVIGLHVMTQIKTLYGKARFLPLCVELDYISGKIYVECEAFEKIRVPYKKAGLGTGKVKHGQRL